MDYQNLTQRDVRHLYQDDGARRSRHHYWLGLAAIPIVIASFFSLASDHRGVAAPQDQIESAEPEETLALVLPESVLLTTPEVGEIDVDPATEMAADSPVAPAPAAETAEWIAVKVQSGDSLARIFGRESLGART
ncbi:MAG TPA: hypothetical protein VLA26_00070, partial [Gammaproteobacteria bacterium]|nr:hypothetical protein [Gammaproteobacteria bacterium]